MPSPFTSSFASAAAGNTSNEGGSNGRNGGSGDWSRARTNGATTTFRRSSVATNLSQQKDGNQPNSNPPPSAGAYVPPHLASGYQSSFSRNGSSDTRYSKDQLLEMFKSQDRAGPTATNINDLLVDGWTPESTNGASNGGWGKRDDHKDAGPEICWDHEGAVHPLALIEVTEEELEAFSTSVNSPLKPPAQNKDGTPNSATVNRRTSVTQSQMGDSPSTRPAGRRRDSADLPQSSNSLVSPRSNRFSKEESSISSPPPSLLRRKTDHKASFGPSLDDKERDSGRPSIDTSAPFGPLKRTSTQPLGPSLNGPSSPWSGAPASAGFTPMGAFGNFGLAPTPTAGEKKPGFGSLRGESRFKDLMSGESSESMNSRMKEKASRSNLERLPESKKEHSRSPWDDGRATHHPDSDRNSYEEDLQYPAGSAALGGDEPSPPLPQSSRYRDSDRQTSDEDIGFSSLGLSSDMPPFRDLMQHRREYTSQQTPQRNPGLNQVHEPMSPTDTNPYQSPEGNKAMPGEPDPDDLETHNQQYPRSASFARGFHNQLDACMGEQGSTSSRNTSRAFPSLGGLGGLNGLSGTGPWSAAPGAVGTPTRAQPAPVGFGDAPFAALGDLNLPAQGGFGGAGFFGSAGPSAQSIPTASGRGSKLSSLFPNAMQDQVRNEQTRQDSGFGDGADAFQRASGNNAPGFGAGLRELDSSQLGRSRLDDILASEDRLRSMQGLGSPFTTAESSQIPASAAAITPFTTAPSAGGYLGLNQDSDSSAASNQMPASQQRQMVMPDRMRWIYRDPQGNQQGPWSGLEMHDWYKAGFFSPELQVKKLEDADYEPLAQLIRRIGNSREPFLVPQIGIPHGPANAPPTAAPTAIPAATPSAAQPNSAQPPFAGSFPSFGTTLTAEQQNALERRKQEEQYLMARQKEHLAQMQPVLQRQMQHIQGGLHGQQLHHHSSAHSLQSQPSYGSIISPAGYQPSPSGGPIQPPSVPGFFEGMPRNAGPLGTDVLGSQREEDLPAFMERMNVGHGGQPQYGASSYSQETQNHQQQVNAMLQERARMQREQEQYDMQRDSNEPRGTAERLEQYHQLRSQEQEQDYQHQDSIGRQVGRPQAQKSDYDKDPLPTSQRPPERLSLSEQVQKAAAKQSPGMQPQSPWAKIDTGMPQPFPPPQSSSPMPAPTPQRNRQSVADALNAESQSPQPDPAETPSAAIAPWAKENTDASKGPSLKEIQATEARKAAQQEEIAAAARRAAAEQERMNQQNQPVAPAPGLPSSANWASSISPAVPATTGASPWAKPVNGKPTATTPVSGAKKTLAQIQKEEEARKNKAAATAAATSANLASTVTATAGGKRYADLAGKVALPTSQNTAWTTVGASGKAKPPTAPAPALNTRTASGGIVQPMSTDVKPKPTVSTAAKTGSGQQNANDEFQKWTRSALSKGLNSNIPVDDFIHSLLHLPPEADIISDSIYASSQTLDGRRFAEEFVRRRRLADRGIIPDANSSTGFSSPSNAEGKGSGGWSEVAKKGGVNSSGGAGKEAEAFMVVKGKKKGGKR